MTDSLSYWAVVPAAGVGRRMGTAIPKQYLPLSGTTVLDATLGRLLSHPQIQGVVVAVSAEDVWWPKSGFYSHERIISATGGKERCDSVLNALLRLETEVRPETFVLVHDAARPCVRHADISKLIQSVGNSSDGGLLGMPVRDTMKRTANAGEIIDTLDRQNMWHAFTPQLFRLDLLRTALQTAVEKDQVITDESSAMELSGYKPVMVEGKADNLKITRPEDLPLAEYYLVNREE